VVYSTCQLWCAWRCLHSAKACCRKNIIKNIIVSRVLMFIYHLSMNFLDLFFLKHIQKNFLLLSDADWKLDISCRDWGAWEQSEVKRSWMEELAGEWRKLLVCTFKPWHSTAVCLLQFAVYIKGSSKLKYCVSENFCSQTFMGTVLGFDCVVK
jgi:hypothetical protein